MMNIPYHMVIKPFLLLRLAAEYRSRWWVWPTIVWRPSEVYNSCLRWSDVPEIWSKLAVWTYPTSIRRPRLGWPHWNFA